jgi:hypothetical protein
VGGGAAAGAPPLLGVEITLPGVLGYFSFPKPWCSDLSPRNV